MKVFIKTKEGIRQVFYINPANLPRLKEKYKDRLEVAREDNRALDGKYTPQ